MARVPAQETPVFFYGLFMDADLLREQGCTPRGVRRADLRGYQLRIGSRATVIPDPRSHVEGVVMDLRPDELARLYGQPGLEGYRPVPVRARLMDGRDIESRCYTLADPPQQGEPDGDYAKRLRAVAAKVGLTDEYVRSIGVSEEGDR